MCYGCSWRYHWECSDSNIAILNWLWWFLFVPTKLTLGLSINSQNEFPLHLRIYDSMICENLLVSRNIKYIDWWMMWLCQQYYWECQGRILHGNHPGYSNCICKSCHQPDKLASGANPKGEKKAKHAGIIFCLHQTMTDDITMYCHLPLAGCIHNMIPKHGITAKGMNKATYRKCPLKICTIFHSVMIISILGGFMLLVTCDYIPDLNHWGWTQIIYTQVTHG